MSEPIHLLVDPGNPDGAARTFDNVEKQFGSAEKSIEIFMYVWRNDEVGNRLGQGVLEAADRGVQVRILKDRGAIMFERIEMNGKSFFHTPLSRLTRWKYKFIGRTFPDTHVEDDYGTGLGERVSNHPNVEIEWVNHTHTKYYVLDERVMITGSINIEDRHRGYRDYMFEITGEDHVGRFRERSAGQVPYDPGRQVDFLLNRVSPGKREFEIKPRMIELLEGARRSLYIEMAYIGDPDISRAIVAAANRGVDVTMLFSRDANIGDDINWRSLHRICRRAPVQVVITDKMIHSKLMLIDDATVIAGSANFSVFSMQKAVELDLVVHGLPGLVEDVRQEAQRRIDDSQRVESAADLKKYNRVLASLQQLHQWLS